jgi:hypothetical protein
MPFGPGYGCGQEIEVDQVAGSRLAAKVFRVHPAVASLKVATV